MKIKELSERMWLKRVESVKKEARDLSLPNRGRWGTATFLNRRTCYNYPGGRALGEVLHLSSVGCTHSLFRHTLCTCLVKLLDTKGKVYKYYECEHLPYEEDCPSRWNRKLERRWV